MLQGAQSPHGIPLGQFRKITPKMSTGHLKPSVLRDCRPRSASHQRRWATKTPRFEALESRRVPSAFGDPTVGEATLDSPNQTYAQAVDLGNLWVNSAVVRHGLLGASETGAGDVEWYQFELDRPARVALKLEGSQPDSMFRGVLSLFNQDFDGDDPLNPQGLRRLELAVGGDGENGVASLDRNLGPGIYHLAVSGAGNEIFSPLVAHTGLPGSLGAFDLSLNVRAAEPAVSDGPWILNSTPAPESLLTGAPLAIRVELSRPLDPASVEAGRSVHLTFSPDGTFHGEGVQTVPLAVLRYASSAGEIQMIPAFPLAPGFYQVVLAGHGEPGSSVLTGLDGTPLGSDGLHPAGQDYLFTFQVGGIEGSANLDGPADDTPAGAHELGELTLSAPIRIAAAIGDDPYYHPANAPDPDGPTGSFEAVHDLDLYHFRVSGPGPYKFFADVFAGRIGSPLGAGLRLFRLNTDSQKLDAIDLPAFFYSIIPYDDRDVLPQLLDTTSYVDLEAGDYYISVSSGNPWSYDPNVSRSNRDGQESGPYVLNLSLSPATATDESPFSRVQPTPAFEPEPTDSEGEDDSDPESGIGSGDPPGHGAPPLPNGPGDGSGVSIPGTIPQGNESLPVGGARPPGGEGSTYTPRPPGGGSSTYKPLPPEGSNPPGEVTQPVTPPSQDTPTTGTRPPGGETSTSTPRPPLESDLPVGLESTSPLTPPFQTTPVTDVRPPVVENSSASPRLPDHQPDAASSSTDLSVLGFQPVGGVTKTEQEPVAPVRPNLSKAVGVTSASTFSSPGMTAETPTIPEPAPAAAAPIVPGDGSNQTEPKPAHVIPSTDHFGEVPQTLVPWSPDPDQFDSRRAAAATESPGTIGRVLEFKLPSVWGQLATTPIEQGTDLERIAEQAGPALASRLSDRGGIDPEDPRSPALIAPPLSSPEDQDVEQPQVWKLGWASLAIATLSCVTYFRYRGQFKPRWWSRASLLEQADNRPSVGESWGSS